jgi:hypothetical protein
VALGLVLLEAEPVAVGLDVLENVMILMTLEPPFLPVESDRFRADGLLEACLLLERLVFGAVPLG